MSEKSDLRQRLAPVLDAGVGSGQITRSEALHLLDLLGVDQVVRRWQRTEVSDAVAMAEVSMWVSAVSPDDLGTGRVKWVDLFGIDPDYTGGQPIDEYLAEQRGEA